MPYLRLNCAQATHRAEFAADFARHVEAGLRHTVLALLAPLAFFMTCRHDPYKLQFQSATQMSLSNWNLVKRALERTGQEGNGCFHERGFGKEKKMGPRHCCETQVCFFRQRQLYRDGSAILRCSRAVGPRQPRRSACCSCDVIMTRVLPAEGVFE